MLSDETETLFLCLEKNPTLLEEAKDVFFMRARYSSETQLLKQKNLLSMQSFKAWAEELENYGEKVLLQWPQTDSIDVCLYFPTQHKEENLFNFAKIFSVLRPGGVLVSSMHNTLGASRFEKHQNELFGNVESLSKHKCRAFWSKKNSAPGELCESWLSKGSYQKVEGSTLSSRPGIFGWDKIDVGSQLLCEFLPRELNGYGADFGCGYGFLSDYVLKNIAGVKGITLYDSELLAVQASEYNLKDYKDKFKLEFIWQDLSKGSLPAVFDWIVMNPPFHVGKTVDPELGYKIVRQAHAALKPGGVLHMVANVKLPYEPVLKEKFTSAERVKNASSFKVLRAVK